LLPDRPLGPSGPAHSTQAEEEKLPLHGEANADIGALQPCRHFTKQNDDMMLDSLSGGGYDVIV